MTDRDHFAGTGDAPDSPKPINGGAVDRSKPINGPPIPLVPAEMLHALTVAHAEIARLRLTDAERECLEWAAEIAGNCEEFDRVSTLRGLLERLGGGR